MFQRGSEDAAQRQRLERVLAEVVQAEEKGRPVDESRLLRDHPTLAAEIKSFLRNRSAVRRVTEQIPLHDLPTWDLEKRPQAPRPGELIGYFGDYELLEEIGRGGMGVVYKAHQISLNRIVALKLILAGDFASSQDIQRFHAEAKAAANLQHPHIVAVHEIGEHEGRHYFSMDYVEGPSLAQQLAAGPLPPLVAVRLLRKIVAAVACAHAQGIIHRDLKPGNILLARPPPSSAEAGGDEMDLWEPRITDFGLAKLAGGESHLTATGQVIGTPSYMPPEQAAGKSSDVGPAADIYALGGLLYTLLTAEPPFQGSGSVEVLLQVLEGEPPRLRAVRPEVPRELEWICLKCLEKRPQDRYASAAELAADLDRFLRREPPLARTGGLSQRIRRWLRRQPVLAWHVIAIGAGLLLEQLIHCLRPERGLVYHLKICGVLALWIAACAALDAVSRGHSPRRMPYVWSAADALFLTALLSLSLPPLGALPAGYLLLICAAGLYFQTRLVVFTTASVMLAYAGLLLLRPDDRPTFDRAALFEAILAIAGLIVGHQVWRFTVLREYYQDYKEP